MAYRTAVKKFRELHVAKSELIWNTICKTGDVKLFEKKYIEFLHGAKNINPAMSLDLLRFPNRTFAKFPTDSLKRMFTKSFTIVKNKDIKLHTGMYNVMIQNYVSNDIHFNLDEFIDDMKKNEIEHNQRTVRLMLRYYCEIGQTTAVELYLKEFKKLFYSLKAQEIASVIYCYIINGQFDELKQFMAEYNIDKDSLFVLEAEASAYASLGDMDNSICLLNKLKSIGIRSQSIQSNLFRRLCQKGVSESDKITFLDLISPNFGSYSIHNLIYHLNRFELFPDALHITQKFNHKIQYSLDVQNIINSFNSSNCPKNVYKDLIQLLRDRSDEKQMNLFWHMTFAEAVHMVMNDCSTISIDKFYVSLFNRAMDDESVDSIITSIKIGKTLLPYPFLNELLVLHIFPLLLESGIVSNTIEIMKLMSNDINNIQSIILFFNFMKGNFNDVVNYDLEMLKKLRISGLSKIARVIVNDMDLSEITNFFHESYKYFDAIFLNLLLKMVINRRLFTLSNINNDDSIEETLKLTEIFNVQFCNRDLLSLKSTNLRKNEAFKAFCETLDQ